MTALIDADSFIYKVGFALEEAIDWEGDGDTVYYPNYKASKTAIDNQIQSIMFATGCDDYELYLTGKSNFRDSNPLGYKQNRVGMRKPAGFKDIKEYLIEEYKAIIIDDVEADDIVVSLKSSFPEDYVLVAQDKDVLYQTEGTHYNYNKDEMITVTAKEAIWFKYYQTLVGDTVDGYKGCYRIGDKKAKVILPEPNEWEDERRDLWIPTILTYRKQGMKLSDAVNTMRLADMTQYNGKEVVLFNPKDLR